MKSLTSYPGVLTLLLVAAGLFINGLVDYINYEMASASVLGAFSCLISAMVLVGVYEFRNYRDRHKSLPSSKS
ncbi:MAG: hypothetical protein ACK4FF_04535 [Limnobacter sp.]|uniref:hypothetical protein n=1 Tax=Limnobacter sp. TaxID=2003368 RepID=UPI00391B5B4B